MVKSITCGTCHARLRVTERMQGKTVRCPSCRAIIETPKDTGVEPPPIVEHERAALPPQSNGGRMWVGLALGATVPAAFLIGCVVGFVTCSGVADARVAEFEEANFRLQQQADINERYIAICESNLEARKYDRPRTSENLIPDWEQRLANIEYEAMTYVPPGTRAHVQMEIR